MTIKKILENLDIILVLPELIIIKIGFDYIENYTKKLVIIYKD